MLEDVDSYIQERPDSALAVLDSIDRTKLTGKKETALYSLLYTMALDKNYKDPVDESLIEPAVKYYSKHGDPDTRLKAFFYQGVIFGNQRNYNKAI
ncbi:MAG: tetratricopeptide repeat protein, partial [Candidatus Cryptobacteroides sp.]|nr:tetratricopeptide repeat protein [Candidatus Cryptobacteroides sp.]